MDVGILIILLIGEAGHVDGIIATERYSLVLEIFLQKFSPKPLVLFLTLVLCHRDLVIISLFQVGILDEQASTVLCVQCVLPLLCGGIPVPRQLEWFILYASPLVGRFGLNVCLHSCAHVFVNFPKLRFMPRFRSFTTKHKLIKHGHEGWVLRQHAQLHQSLT